MVRTLSSTDKPALGIAEESPQPDVGGARTCNGKPDPCGNALNIIVLKPFGKGTVCFLKF